MTELLLVRHGQTEWNEQGRYIGWQEVGLSATGRQQAEALAKCLSGNGIDALYTSDLRRTVETAAAISKSVVIETIPDPRLREMCFGAIEGLTFDDARARFPAMIASWLADWEQPPSGAESFSEFSARVSSFLDHLGISHAEDSVLVVSHGGPIREILRLTLGLPPRGHWYFEIDNASLTKITLYRDHTVVNYLNDMHHLQGINDGG